MDIYSMNRLLVVMVMLGVAACSSKGVYESTRIHQRNDCVKQPPALYEECLERVNKPYEEYERERKVLLEE